MDVIHALVKDDTVAQRIWEKEEGRNKAVGMRIGRLVYYLVFHGRPDRDFPILVYASVQNGLDMGDINHSLYFVTRLLPHLVSLSVSSVTVRRRMMLLLSIRVKATGCKLPICGLADETHQRESRQFVGVTTLNPGAAGSALIITLLLGVPKCP